MFDITRVDSSDLSIDHTAPPFRNCSPGGSDAAMLPRLGCLQGASPSMQELFETIQRVAASDASVILLGESGSGKEMAAKTVHMLSRNASKPFIAVNCGAIPSTLIEAELFGYEKGAFTGAHRSHQGFFERAHGGTLLLDEITEMPMDMQVRLLRVLETEKILRIGGTKEIDCHVRLLSATNRSPLSAMEQGVLREDLFYRIAVFPLHIPPLREREDDVLLLAQHFLNALNLSNGTEKYFDEMAKDKIRQHSWPGNVRELKNCVQRAHILADQAITPTDFGDLGGIQSNKTANALEFEVGVSLSEVEKQLIFATLDYYKGNKPRTAETLGVSLKTLYNRLNEYMLTDTLPQNGLSKGSVMGGVPTA